MRKDQILSAKEIEKAKREAKERMSKSIDAYYERFAEAKKDGLPSIDEIEAMWGEGQRDILEILKDATNTLAGTEVDTVKKTVRDVIGE